MSTGFQCGVCPGHGKVTQNRWLKWYVKQSIVSIKVKRNVVMPSAYSFMSPMAQQKTGIIADPKQSPGDYATVQWQSGWAGTTNRNKLHSLTKLWLKPVTILDINAKSFGDSSKQNAMINYINWDSVTLHTDHGQRLAKYHLEPFKCCFHTVTGFISRLELFHQYSTFDW